MNIKNLMNMEKELMIYQSANGEIKVNALFENGTAWLTLEQLCQLFGETELTIGGYLTSIYAEGELRETDTIRKTKPTNYYNIDVVLSLGFRVRSNKGQQFRVWAMQQLRESMLK